VFAPFRKGDPEGNRWMDNDPLYIDWSAEAVNWLFEKNGRSGPGMPVIRNAHMYFRSGIAFSRHGRSVALKFRLQPSCVFDAASPRFTSVFPKISTTVLLAILNSAISTFYIKKFLNNTWYEMSDLRQMPLVMPTRQQERQIKVLAELCLEAKRLALDAKPASQELVATARQWLADLRAAAPQYLRPPAQACTLQSPEDCLALFELAVNWHVEKLYGVEGLGPFDDF